MAGASTSVGGREARGGTGGRSAVAGAPSHGGSAGKSEAGGTTSRGGAGGKSESGGAPSESGAPGDGGMAGEVTLPPATGTPGKWENVTSPDMDPALFTGSSGFGVGNIVQDPHRPTDMYVGGYGSLWKSVDYGLTWAEVPSSTKPGSEPLGHVLAIGGDAGKTVLWLANGIGAQKVYRSTNGGLDFVLTGTLSGGPDAALYSIVVDPTDPKHLISGFHEQDGLAESTDSGDTWTYAGTTGWPSGGVSWFPFFIDMGDAAKTRTTWLAIAQNGASVVMTSDGGKTWSIPDGISGLQHPHGNSSLYQDGETLFIAGTGGPTGDGVYRSTDRGQSWTRVGTQPQGIVWGSSKNVYAMWGWACASCTWGGPTQSQVAPQPGTDWSNASTDATNGLNWGPNSVAVTSDGSHAIFVGSMWASGLWRYVEP
jgi:hypothetical protein